MSSILQISITFLCVIVCTATAQTSEAPPLAPQCEGDICYCSPGTHEAVFNGRKFCETDSTESCPEHAIRLSPQVCECKKGYRYLNDERKVCIPEHMEPPVIPVDDDEENVDSKAATTETTTPTTTTQRIIIPTTSQATTPTTTNSITTSTKPERSEESETGSNAFYITVGIVVLIITALILIALLWLLYKR